MNGHTQVLLITEIKKVHNNVNTILNKMKGMSSSILVLRWGPGPMQTCYIRVQYMTVVGCCVNHVNNYFIKAASAETFAAYLLAAAGQCHSVDKRKCRVHVYFFAQYIVTNISVRYTKSLL
jgi:hypothetical protein